MENLILDGQNTTSLYIENDILYIVVQFLRFSRNLKDRFDCIAVVVRNHSITRL